MTSLVTIKFPESEEKHLKAHVNVKSKVAYHCSNDRRPPCLENCVCSEMVLGVNIYINKGNDWLLYQYMSRQDKRRCLNDK